MEMIFTKGNTYWNDDSNGWTSSISQQLTEGNSVSFNIDSIECHSETEAAAVAKRDFVLRSIAISNKVYPKEGLTIVC